MTSDKKSLPIWPTGKQHISFSELATWLECPYKHKLVYVDKLGTFDGNEHTEFGGHVHHGCETFIRSGSIPVDEVIERIAKTWRERDFADADQWIAQAKGILSEVPQWMDKTFPGWEPIDAEHLLYEDLTHLGHPDMNWKGYVDATIKHKGARGRDIVRIIDWKTTAWGWRQQKLRDFKTNAQAAAYKIFWAKKFDIDPKDIRAAFVLLKRDAKPGTRCQMIEVSVGPKMHERVEQTIDKMIRSVLLGRSPKNRTSCKFCEFNATEHCPGLG